MQNILGDQQYCTRMNSEPHLIANMAYYFHSQQFQMNQLLTNVTALSILMTGLGLPLLDAWLPMLGQRAYYLVMMDMILSLRANAFKILILLHCEIAPIHRDTPPTAALQHIESQTTLKEFVNFRGCQIVLKTISLQLLIRNLYHHYWTSWFLQFNPIDYCQLRTVWTTLLLSV